MADVKTELLTRARNLERYPFESATMAEAGRLAAKHLRETASDLHKNPPEAVHDEETCTFREELSAACGYLRNAQIDLETGAPKATAIRTIKGGLARAEAALASSHDAPTIETGEKR